MCKQKPLMKLTWDQELKYKNISPLSTKGLTNDEL